MRKSFARNTFVLLFALVMICLSFGFLGCVSENEQTPTPTKKDVEITYQSSLYEWRMVGYPYTVENYSVAVRVYDPNGNPVEVSYEGRFVLTVAGEYTIIYPSGMKRLHSLYTKPVSVLNFSSEIESVYPAGTVIELPALQTENPAYDFNYYYVEINIDSEKIETIRVKTGESTLYLLDKAGEYRFRYFVINDRGETESATLTVTVGNRKAIIADELPLSVNVGDSVEIGYPYAFYNQKFYDVAVTITCPNGEKVVANYDFTPKSVGEYTVTYAANIEGENLVGEKKFTAYSPKETIFNIVNGEGTESGIANLPSWNTNDNFSEGLLLNGTTDNVKFVYNGVVDLSVLTKDDNLLVFLPYSDKDEDAYMEGLRVVFTDVHDANRKISLYFWATASAMGNVNVPNTFSTVEFGSVRYGISTQSYGRLDANTGSIAWGSSFKGAHNEKSDTFTIQYDYASEILYITTERNPVSYPMQQYVFLALSDKGTIPENVSRLPEDYWFSGFTTGEVYVSIELVNNNNAGVYICEIAGKTASELQENLQYVVFDEEIKELPIGVVGYEYNLPSVHLNEMLEGSGEISVSVKDADGENVVLSNGKFTPTAAGNYIATYSLDYCGKISEYVYEFTVKQNPVDINIKVNVGDISFGDRIDEPEIIITGGNGILNYKYGIMLGSSEISLGRDGKYFISEEGNLKITVTASDNFGYSKTEDFIFDISNGYVFTIDGKLPTAVRIGQNTSIPSALVTKLTNGIYESERINAKAYENGVEKAIVNGSFVPSSDAEEIKFEYSYEYGGKTFTETHFVDIIPETVYSVTDYVITTGTVKKSITEAGILLTAENDATVKMPYPVASENLLISVGFHKNGASVDSWEILLRDTEYSDMVVKLTLSEFDAEKATANVSFNGSSVKSLKGRTNVYTEHCGNAVITAKYAGTEYVVFSVLINSTKAMIVDYDTNVKLFDLTTFANGIPFTGFSDNACVFESSVKNGSGAESNLLLCQIGNQYFRYGEDIFGYTDSDGIAPVIVINGSGIDRTVSYGYTLTVPSAIAYDVLGGIFGVKVRMIANGEEIVSARSAESAFDFRLEEYKVYTVVYEVRDRAGNLATESFTVTVKDEEPPTLIVNGDYAKKLKTGDSVIIKTFTATDGQSNVETVIFVKDNQTKLSFVKPNGEYTFKESGVYEIVYRAVDESSNMVRISFTIVVE